MVEMSSFKIPNLPPSIQRLRCGGDEASHHGSERRNLSYPPSRRTSTGTASAGDGSDRLKSFVHGIVSPFTACWQPTVTSCGCAPDYSTAFHKKPAIVVSPLVHRPSAASYLDSRASPMIGEEESSVVECSATSHNPPHPNQPPSTNSPPRNVIDNSSLTNSTDIEKPHANDVLCGRGGSSNRHLGNIHFRELVAANKKIYVGLTKKQKMLIARRIVDAVRSTEPPGRFLAKDSNSRLYYDIGLPRSLEKTSQALREKNSNEMPLEQQQAEEGIETSVESFQTVVSENAVKEISDETTVTSSQQVDGETPEVEANSSHKSPKNVEAPPLSIPPHLMSIYGPKKERHEQHEHLQEKDTLSPSGPLYTSTSPYESGYQSPYNSNGSLTGPRPGYPHSAHCPRHPAYPPTSPPSAYSEHGRYYYAHHHHPHQQYHSPYSSPYGPYGSYPQDHHRRHHCPHQPQDKREAYSEYYSQSAERESPHRSKSHGRPYAVPHHYAMGRYPPAHPLALSAPRRPHGAPPSPDDHPTRRSTSHGSPVSPPSCRPSPYSGHPSPHHYPPFHHSGALPPPAPTNPHRERASSQIIYRTPSNGYVRGTCEISPERLREVKRQRNNVDGHIRRVSESSLSSAVRKSLTLEEKVVGRERNISTRTNAAPSTPSTAKSTVGTSTTVELVSPSSILQSRSRRSMDGKEKGTASRSLEDKVDYSGLSGLAALSTAAFLKLDEEA